MPLFEFQCEECDETFEELLRRSDEATQVRCPACGSARVRRLQSGFATVGTSSGSVASPPSSCSIGGGPT
jgi:putative FmdB family regulatory protein